MKPLITISTIIIIIALMITCTEKPTSPQKTNPFDPENSQTLGDPFQLEVAIANGGITLSWTSPKTEGIANFKIYRSNQETTDYTELDQIESSASEYVDSTVQNGHSYWYRVSAVDSKGKETQMTNTAAANIKTEPVITINGGAEYTSIREVNLTILASSATQMMLSNSGDLNDGNWETYASSKTWSLEPGAGIKTVYMKAKYDNGNESAVVNTSILPQSPSEPSIVIIADTTQFTQTRSVDIHLTATGSNLQMKLSNDSTFAGIDWEAYQTTTNFQLNTGEGEKRVFAKFKNDFELETDIVSDGIFPQPMNPTISIINGAVYTQNRNININMSVNGSNLQIKLSEDSTFSGLKWQNFSSSPSYQLSLGDGVKTVFAQVKNDFEIESQIINDDIIFDSTPPTIGVAIVPDSGVTSETEFEYDPRASTDNLTETVDLDFRLDFEDDGTFDTNWSSLTTISHMYALGGGDKSVRMNLRDGAGWIADTTVTLFVNTRPEASFTATEDASNLLLYHFDASASLDYEDGGNLQYRWDFNGDGSWDTDYLAGATIEYEYVVVGNYSPQLSVRDQHRLTDDNFQSINVFDGTVTDIDGNVYQAIKIGDQWWMTENLKVTHFRNGDPIVHVTSNTDWTNVDSSAYCTYDNEGGNEDIYGFLYNLYVVNDGRHIAPQGWHVPTDDEWKELEMYLGMSQSDVDATGWRGTDEGGKLKELGTAHWLNPNTGATNESGYYALPGGYRSSTDGTFKFIGTSGYFWSSTVYRTYNAWYRKLSNNNSGVNRGSSYEKYGFSVRCIKDR